MNKNIKISIRTGVVALASLLACYSCSDTWDDHYNATNGGVVVDATLYQQMKSDNNLSDFLEIIDATGYKALLDESQIVTVFAPVNGSFNKDSLLNEIANGNKKLVITRFVKNHIARYNYSSNADKQTVTLLNQKSTTLTDGVVGIDSVKAKSVNTICNNGILHVMNSILPFHSNIYEAMEVDADMDSIYTVLKTYDEDSLDVARSVYRGVDADGNRIYVDSVIINTNELMAHLDGFIQREDSSYLAIVPSNKAYNERFKTVMGYFNYNLHEDERDSLQQYYSNYYTLNTLFYNNNRNVHPDDSLVTTTYSRWNPKYNVFYKPYLEGGILAPGTYTDKVACSNGVIYKVDHFPTSIYDAFFHEIKLEAESTGNINIDEDASGNALYTKTANYSHVSINNDSVSNHACLDVQPIGSSQPYLAYNIPNTLSGTYDMYIVTVPLKLAYKYGLSINEVDTMKAYQFRVNMFYRTNKASDSGSSWPTTKSETLKNPAEASSQNFVSDPTRVDTIFLGTKTFTESYYNTNNAGVMLQIQSYVSSGQLKNYSRRMIFDRILFRPHGMPIKQDEE